MANKRIIIKGVIFLLFLVCSIFILSENKKDHVSVNLLNDYESLVLYYGNTCPHCKIVEKYIEDNSLRETMKIVDKEIHDDKNLGELNERASICGISSSSIGIPFLWSEGRCYVGDEEIINYLKNKVN
ncbi:MAG: hypothetical protein PHW52_03885 [Candidatus Pacebacteria bacterium]|nr:hypothetical protein [Candidatus Paceibacterota bacterium]